MGLTVKICGLKTADAVEAAVAGGADMLGFVFFEPSPRNIGLEQAADLMRRVPQNLTKVALVVDPDDALLDGIVRQARPDLIQFHGKEGPERLALAKARYRIPVMKALPVAGPGDIAKHEAYLGTADRLLFDAKAPKDADRPGGNALAFDWQLLKGRPVGLPWILAGGLNEANLARAVAISGATAVDISSGVETEPGVKDPNLIRTFLETAKGLKAA
ncbi:MAG: phosphoribosylanthranilate isomerase [Rhodospirillales bacterium]